MALRSSLPTLLFALLGAHFSCPLLQLTQRDAEQVQAVLLGDRSPEGLDLATRSRSTWRLLSSYRGSGSYQKYCSPNHQEEATAVLLC